MSEAPLLAEFNVARVRYSLDDPRMAEFVDNVDRVNKLAEKIDGFVWRLQDDSGHAMNMLVYNDPTVLPNLTLWRDEAALERFIWQTVHGRFYRRREEWFAPMQTPLAMWWAESGERPTMAEGVKRRDHLIAHGASAYAFGWENLPNAALWKSERAKPSECAA
jgi:hypothetical protein